MSNRKQVLRFDPRQDTAADIAQVALGPTGNLRAPAARVGQTWLIGFSEELYSESFGRRDSFRS